MPLTSIPRRQAPSPRRRPRRALRLARAALAGLATAWLGAGSGMAQANIGESQADLQLNATLPPVAPVVVPRAPLGTVVPSQVLRWRQEATALEHGDSGLPRDPARAATLYCQAARHGDAESQFALAWMLTNARGVERDEAAAAHLFAAAAEQGLPQALRMAGRLGTPLGDPPACLRPPEAEAPPVATAAAPAARAALPRMPALPGLAGTALALRPATAGLRPLAQHPLYAEAPRPIAEFVRMVAPDYQVPPQLVLAVMSAESGFNPNAVSPAQAQGLMQLIPDTAARFKVRNLMDPAQNIRGGMAYLRWLLAYFEGDVVLTVAAYNAGERAVERYRGIPPYNETRNYVRKVLALFDEAPIVPFDARITGPSSAIAQLRMLARR